MSAIAVIAQFTVLVNGVSMQVEAVSVEAGLCPRPSASAVSLMPSAETHSVCRGMVYETGHVRYWALSRRHSGSDSGRLLGWQTRVPAKDFPKLLAGRGLTVAFPETALSFELNPTGQRGPVP